MRKKVVAILLVTALGLLGPALLAQAEIYSFQFYAFTQRDPSGVDRVCLQVNIRDGRYRAPDAIKSLTVTAPDGTVFNLTNHCWLDLAKQFWLSPASDQFDSKTLPAGKYTARVVDKSNRAFTSSINLAMNFLDVPVITSPTNNQEIDISVAPPVFTWNRVTGAQHYRILLKDLTWGEPVYWKPAEINEHRSYTNSYRVPLGDLMPGHQYSLRIEARDTDKGLNKRSVSNWINFTAVIPAP
jgi:hypothetical protein